MENLENLTTSTIAVQEIPREVSVRGTDPVGNAFFYVFCAVGLYLIALGVSFLYRRATRKKDKQIDTQLTRSFLPEDYHNPKQTKSYIQ